MSIRIMVREEIFIKDLPEDIKAFFFEQNLFKNPEKEAFARRMDRWLNENDGDPQDGAWKKKHRQVLWTFHRMPNTIRLYREKDSWISLPRGYLANAVAHLRQKGIEPEIEFAGPEVPSMTGVKITGELFDYQKDALRKLISAGTNGVMEAPTGCVSGETIIHLNRAGKGYKLPIKDAYKRQFGHQWHRNKNIVSHTRSLIRSNRIGLHPIDNIAYSGKKIVCELVLSNGFKLKATPDHLVFTINGFVPIANLKPGDCVFCENHRPGPTGKNLYKKNYRQVQGLRYHPYAGTARSLRRRGNWKPEGRLYRVAYHRLVAEADLNQITVDELIAICRTGKERAANLSFLDPNAIAVHHCDHNHLHNYSRNLKSLTHNEHRSEHADYAHFNQGIPFVSEVVSVSPQGEEDTYDIICKDPCRNFVANGIIVHNSGKTNILLSLIAELSVPTLVVVHTTELLKQTAKRCKDWLGVDPGTLGGGKKKLADITIGMIQTLSKLNIDKNHELYSRFGCVIGDEIHHCPAATYVDVFRRLPYRYKYGFTATAWRKDKMESILWRVIGPITSKVNHREVAKAGRIVWPEFHFIPTNYFYRIEDANEWTSMISDLVENGDRNLLIAENISTYLGKYPEAKALILTDRIDHANTLAAMGKSINPVLLTGRMKKRERSEAMDKIRAGARLTIATVHLLGEGVDVPGWSLLFLVSPFSGGPRTLQVVGRIARPAAGKDRAILIDFVDHRIPMLRAAAKARERLYESKGEKHNAMEQSAVFDF